ncbi:GntR family transcriptional regulator [Raineyella sp. LH-20]|uniref:GntR family transcriptional regulator n=1 Tax=Raineyella sp. LH-20 TaxID=3081204 RepID=UPI0029537151|nr:GntR family transcriptional regulator [Raineyella sp. LH-20]WOP18855.1 GntR family transcriptional regulator [Raineyella sp. LH-20]
MSAALNLRAARRRGENTRRLVYDFLRERIVDLQLPPGEPLSEADIAERLGVSRTPVRESLILLSEEGLVDVYPQRGSFVGPIRLEEVLSAQFVRETLECASLDSAVPRVGGGEDAPLRALIDQQRRADERQDVDEFFALDERFHQQLMALGGHETAWRVVAQAKTQLDRVRHLSLPRIESLGRLIDQHQEVLDAAAAGDTPRAVAALRAHLRLVLADLDLIRGQNPEFFAADDE